MKILVSFALILNLSLNLMADENVEVLKEFKNALSKTTQKDGTREKRVYNSNKSKVEELLGDWSFTYTVDGKTYKDEVSLDKVSLSSSTGYIVTGTNKPINTNVKQPIACLYFDNYYEYICSTVLSAGYIIGYTFDKSGNYAYGAYGLADNSEDVAYQTALGLIDLYGVRQTSTATSTTNSTSSYNYGNTNSTTTTNTTTTNTTTSSSDNIYVTDLKNKSFNIGWYFWTSDSGKAYLASQKNGKVSVWNFTDERKWRPIYNAPAFDGYASAGDTFSNVYFSTDKKSITFGASLSTNQFTTDLANKSNSIGWYFWMSDSDKAYLANGRDSSNGVAIWNFTDERKWRPVHNAPAFDGYEKADKVFSNVTISSDGTSITIK